MMVYLLRHGRTVGNQKGRYIGTTDEPLLAEEIKRLAAKTLPQIPLLYVSPLRRCRESAKILFPDLLQNVVEDFRECDFGEFENKNYLELAGNPAYQAWIDSGGRADFPGGESREAFRERCARAFARIVRETAAQGCASAACVIHGGTIMSILETYALPRRDYFDYQVKNGCGYAVWTEAAEDRQIRCEIRGEL